MSGSENVAKMMARLKLGILYQSAAPARPKSDEKNLTAIKMPKNGMPQNAANNPNHSLFHLTRGRRYSNAKWAHKNSAKIVMKIKVVSIAVYENARSAADA